MIILLLLLSFLTAITSQACDKFCEVCDPLTQVCEQCIQGLAINSLNRKCQSSCKYGQYLLIETQECISICPSQYYNDDDSLTCMLLQKCPFLSDQGMQFFDEFTHSISHQGFVVTSGINYLKDDYTLKMFNATNGKYLGYMEGHDSEVLMLAVVESTQELLSISTYQMIWWNLYYGTQEAIINFGKVDSGNSDDSTPPNEVQNGQKSTYLNYLENASQPILYNEQIIILMQNPKQFGVLYHQQLRTHSQSNNNLSLFQKYFQIFDVQHTSAIKGFFKINESIIASFSSKLFIIWDIKQNFTVSGMQGVCSFQKESIYRILQIGDSNYLIQLLNIPQLYVFNAPLNSCYSIQYDIFPPDDGSTKYIIEEIYIYDQKEQVFLIRTKKAVFFYQLSQSVDLNNLNVPVFSIKEIASEKLDNIFISFVPNQHLLLLQPSGKLKYYSLTKISKNANGSGISIDISLFGLIDFYFKQQMYITNVLYDQSSFITILVGKQLTCAKFINADKKDFENYSILSSLKNISPQVSGHRDQINGIIMDIVFENRIITFSSDGSFKVWIMIDETSQRENFASLAAQGGYLDRAHLLFDQYHPQCDIIESSRCAWGVVSLQQIEYNIILTQYTDNSIVFWNYLEDQIYFNFRYAMYDESVKINNYHYNKDLKYLLICNEVQLAIFDTANDGEVMFNEADTYYRGYFFKGDKGYDNSFTLVKLINVAGAKFKFMLYYYDQPTNTFTFQKQNQFKNQFFYSEIYADNVMLCTTVTNLYYQLRKTPDHINLSQKFPISYFAHDIQTSKTFLLFKNGQVGIGQDTKFVYKNITSSDVTFRCTTIANNPLIFFYFQNNVYYPGFNQVIGLNEALDIVFYLVFEDTITSISADSTNSKLYVGFQNGKIYHGPYIKQLQNMREYNQNLVMPQYSPTLRQLFLNKKTVVQKKDLFGNSTVEFNGVVKNHKQNIEGYILDSKNNMLVTYSKETNTSLYIWSLNNPSQSQKISDPTILGISYAYLDLKGDILIGYSENWLSSSSYNFDIIVWKYSTFQKIAINQSHQKYFEDLKKDELPENISQMQYQVKQLMFVPTNSSLVSLNNYFTVFIYNYQNGSSSQLMINNIFKLFFDDVYNYVYARIADTFAQHIEIYDINFKLLAQKADHIYELRDIIFVDDKTVTYDIQTIIVFNRKDFSQIIKISTQNPKVTNLIISSKLSLAIVWNNFFTEEIQFYKIAIFDLKTGRTIYELQPLSNIENGNTNLAFLEESTCQLYYTRTTGYIYSFDVCNLYYSGIYSPNMQNITDIFYVPEFNYLGTINNNYLCLTRVESSISAKQKFSPLYSSKNINYFINQNENQTYLADFDNSVWKLNNNNFNFEYITQLSKILFSKFYNNYFYIATEDSFEKYDSSFKFQKSISRRLRNMYFSQNFIFFQDETYTLNKLNIDSFTLDNGFSIQLTYYVNSLFILEQFNEIIIYTRTSQYLRINYLSNNQLYQETPLAPFQSSMYSRNLNMIIHIQKNSNLLFYYNLVADMKSQDSSSFYQFNNSSLSSFTTRNVFIDDQYKNLVIAYSDFTIRVFNLVFSDNKIQQINQLLVVPQPSITNILKCKFRGQNLQLYLPWQVIEYDRKQLNLINNFNNSQIIQNMNSYQMSSDVSKYMFISQQSTLQMIDISLQQIVFKFQLSYPQLISQSIQIQTSQYNVEIKGLSNGVFFQYNFFIPKSQDNVFQDSSTKECYFDLGVVERFFNQNNQINILENSLKQLSFQMKKTLIQITPTRSIFYQPIMDYFNSKILFEGKTNNDNAQIRTLNFNDASFLPEKFKEVQVKDYVIEISQIGKLSFNAQTKKVTIKDSIIKGNGKNASLDFNNMNYVILENLVIDSVTLEDNSVLFSCMNSQQVLFKNLTFINTTLKNISKLFLLKNVTSFLMLNVTIDNLHISSYNPSTVIQIYNVRKGFLKNVFLTRIESDSNLNETSINCIFDLQGNSNLTMLNIFYSNSKYMSLIRNKNSYEENQRIYYRVHDTLFLSEINVQNVKNLKESLIKATGYSLNFQNSIISDITCNLCFGGSASFKQINFLTIKNSSFSQSLATNGGAVAILNSLFNQTIIQDSNFTNNKALSSGGAVYLSMSDLQFTGNVVSNNQATIGGGIRYLGIQPQFIDLILKDENNKRLNKIEDNLASIHSNNYGSYAFSSVMVSNLNLTEDKIDNSNQRKLYEKSDSLMVKEYTLQDFQSGGNVDLKFKITDIENNPIKFKSEKVSSRIYPPEIISEIEQFQIKATISNSDIKIYGQYITNYLQFDPLLSEFTIKEMQLVSMPQSQTFIHLEIPAIKRVISQGSFFSNGPFYIKLIINFRKCVQGEIYTPSSSLYLCGECKVGTYSLVEPTLEQASDQLCERCPIEAEQCSRNNIMLKQGYWRISNQTDTILKCANNPLNCVGDESKGYCKLGHYGPLCEQCDVNGEIWGDKYVTDGKYNCVNCTELQTNFKYFLPSILVGIGMVIYMVISIRIALEISELIVIGYYLRKMNLVSISKSAFLDTTNMNMKAMMNYMQIAQLVNTFEVELPDFLKILPQYIGEPISNLMYTLDCSFNEVSNEDFPVVYLRTIWSLTMPFLYVFGMGLIYFILIQCKFAKKSKSYIINGLVFLIFFLQPSMISHLLSVMSCRQIDKMKYVLADITQVCYTRTHILYIFYICIPGLILWGFFIPAFITKRLYTHRNLLDNALIRIPYGFLYQDYKYNMYYWEFIKSYMKILIVVIHNFYGDPYNNKLVLTIILMLLYQVALLRMRPYQMKYFQDIEKRSMEVLIVIVTMNIFLYNRPDIVQQQIFYIIVLGIHNFYQLFLIWEVIKAKVTITYTQNKEIIKQKLKKYLPWIEKWIDMTNKKNMKVFYYWRKIQNEITYAKQKKLKLIQREKAKFYFDDEIDKEREQVKVKNIPITSSQLSIRADYSSMKPSMKDFSGILSPQMERQHSFQQKSSSSKMDSLLFQKEEIQRTNSIFIEFGNSHSFRFNGDETNSNIRQFDRLFEALKEQQKQQNQFVDYEDENDEISIFNHRGRKSKKEETLIYKNLSRVTTSIAPTQPTENQIKYQNSNEENVLQADLDQKQINEENSEYRDLICSSSHLPFQEIKNIISKQQINIFNAYQDQSNQLDEDKVMINKPIEVQVEEEQQICQNLKQFIPQLPDHSNDCNIASADAKEKETNNESNNLLFEQVDQYFNESDSFKPHQFFDKLKKQVTSEYLNDYQQSQFQNNNHNNSSKAFSDSYSDAITFKNALHSAYAVQYKNTDQDNFNENCQYQSSKIEEYSSGFDGHHRVIANFNQLSQKEVAENSIAQMSQVQDFELFSFQNKFTTPTHQKNENQNERIEAELNETNEQSNNQQQLILDEE